MDDQGLNKWLEDNYGRTVDGKPLFRLLWTTNVTEHRFSEYHDYLGDLFIRSVRETREVLKYPFAQDRWVLERIHLVDQGAFNIGLRTDKKYSYEEIYTFQDRNGNFLPLSQESVEAAMYLFFNFYLKLTPKERVDMRMAMLAQREIAKKEKIKESLGDPRSPLFLVIGKRR